MRWRIGTNNWAQQGSFFDLIYSLPSSLEMNKQEEELRVLGEQLIRRHNEYSLKVLSTLTHVAEFKERVNSELELFKQQLQGVLETTL
jgi:hypothetical protein